MVLACVHAGLHNGLTNKLRPTNFINFDNTKGADSIVDDEMPTNLESSLNKFQNSNLLSKYFGKEYLDLYTSTKLGEIEHMSSCFIPKEEYDFYL